MSKAARANMAFDTPKWRWGREPNPRALKVGAKILETKLHEMKFKWILGHFWFWFSSARPFVHFLGTCQVVAEYPISGHRENLQTPIKELQYFCRFQRAQLWEMLGETFLAIKHKADRSLGNNIWSY